LSLLMIIPTKIINKDNVGDFQKQMQAMLKK
jgi:hypothetical protein